MTIPLICWSTTRLHSSGSQSVVRNALLGFLVEWEEIQTQPVALVIYANVHGLGARHPEG